MTTHHGVQTIHNGAKQRTRSNTSAKGRCFRAMRQFLMAAVLLKVRAAHGIDEHDREKWALEWLRKDELNRSTLNEEDRCQEMKFFIKKSVPFRGMQIRVVSEDTATHRFERDVLAPFFRNITGIDLVHDVIAESDVVERLQEQVATGKNTYDAYVSDSDLIGTHWRQCQVESISDWVLNEGAEVTLPSLDIHDFIGLDFVTAPDGKIYQLPDQQFANLYWFRYDLFTDPELKRRFKQIFGYDLGVPLNWAAYEDIARFFTEEVRQINGTRIYGHMDYGANDPSVGWRFTDAWLSMAGAGDTGEPNGLPVDEWGIRVEQTCRPVGASVERGGAVNAPASIYAATKYMEWLQKFAPTEALKLTWGESGNWPPTGQIAQQIFWYTTFTADLRKSPAVTYPDGKPKWRMAPSPHGPYWHQGMKIGYQDVGSWTLLKSTPLDRRRAAWLYAQFTVSKSVSLAKTIEGLTPIRESDLRSQAMTDMAPYLGGLVEFYRSPDRVRWSPTGTNVPDYPRLAPLWWKNVGKATQKVAEGGDPRTEATRAMDHLAHDMDATLYRLGQESGHFCSPKLNERKMQEDRLGHHAPKRKLENEEAQGRTMEYDSLVEAWRRGMQLNYDFGPDVTKQTCNAEGKPLMKWREACPVLMLGNACVDACPPTHQEDPGGSHTCVLVGDSVEHSISNLVDLPLSWGVNEITFFHDRECRQPIDKLAQVVSSGFRDFDGRPTQAFDSLLETAWYSNCSSCKSGTAFVGQKHKLGTEVLCLKVFQSTTYGSVATRLALLRNGVQQAEYQAEGGSWERWPMPDRSGVLWRLTNGKMTERNWALTEVGLFADVNCSLNKKLSGNFSVQASSNWSGWADFVFDDRLDTSWTSDCARCPAGEAFVEMEFHDALPPHAIKCVTVVQQGGLDEINLQQWNGQRWENALVLNSIGSSFEQSHQRPIPKDVLWRLRALELHQGLQVTSEEDEEEEGHGWTVFELRMCLDVHCQEVKRDLIHSHVQASGEMQDHIAINAGDDDLSTWWTADKSSEQWIGWWFERPEQVQCFQIWQSYESWASTLVMERWDNGWQRASPVYKLPSSGYYSNCAWTTGGVLWRMTHEEPVIGAWHIHELELFEDDDCTKLIYPPAYSYTHAQSGQRTLYANFHAKDSMDKRLQTYLSLCGRDTTCEARSLYVGLHFMTPQEVRCFRVWQSGATGRITLEKSLVPTGTSGPAVTSIMEGYQRTDLTVRAQSDRWVWANSRNQSGANEKCFGWGNGSDFCTFCGCLSCLVGHVPIFLGNGQQCHPCAIGRFSPVVGAHKCEECRRGSFSEELGATACKLCQKGTYAASNSSSQCIRCAPGRSQEQEGQEECDSCEPGYFTDQSGQEECKKCPWYQWSGANSDHCSFQTDILSLSLLMLLSLTMASFLIFSTFRYWMPIEDTNTDEGITTLKTVGHHLIRPPVRWKWCGGTKRASSTRSIRSQNTMASMKSQKTLASDGTMSLECISPTDVDTELQIPSSQTSFALEIRTVELLFINSGIPWVEEAGNRVRARVLSNRQLQLLTRDGSNFEHPLETSVGYLTVPWRAALMVTGFIVPVWVMILVFVFTALLALFAGQLPLLALPPGVLLGVLLGYLLYWYRTKKVLRSLHSRRLHRFAAALRRKNPNPKPVPRGPGRAVTVGQLWRLYEYFHNIIQDRDMYYVNTSILLPLTKKSQLSYAELAGPTTLTWYVSHYWGSSFRSFVESIRKHAMAENGHKAWKSASYWICSLGNNQWKVKEELGVDWSESSFFHALRSPECRGTAMVIEQDALPLTRSWCLFEVLQTFLLERDIALFKGLVLCTESGILNQGATSVDCVLAVTKRLAKLKLEDAHASMASDKQMIDDLVVSELGGFSTMNHFLKRKFHAALLAARDKFEMDFQELAGQLSEPLGNSINTNGSASVPVLEADGSYRSRHEEAPWPGGPAAEGPPTPTRPGGGRCFQQL